MTTTKILCGCAAIAFAVQTASAQTKHSISGTCAKPDNEQSVPAGDQPDHTFMIAQGKCTATDEIAVAMSGIKAGTCTYSDGGDGGTKYSCTGDYTLAGVAPAAK